MPTSAKRRIVRPAHGPGHEAEAAEVDVVVVHREDAGPDEDVLLDLHVARQDRPVDHARPRADRGVVHDEDAAAEDDVVGDPAALADGREVADHDPRAERRPRVENGVRADDAGRTEHEGAGVVGNGPRRVPARPRSAAEDGAVLQEDPVADRDVRVDGHVVARGHAGTQPGAVLDHGVPAQRGSGRTRHAANPTSSGPCSRGRTRSSVRGPHGATSAGSSRAACGSSRCPSRNPRAPAPCARPRTGRTPSARP